MYTQVKEDQVSNTLIVKLQIKEQWPHLLLFLKKEVATPKMAVRTNKPINLGRTL